MPAEILYRATITGLDAHDMFFQKLVAAELTRARAKHAPPCSLHHSYAVILEEVDEFWDEVRKQSPRRADIIKELVQIAVTAQRAATELLMRDQSVPRGTSHKKVKTAEFFGLTKHP